MLLSYIFDRSTFQPVELTAAFEHIDYVPGMLGQLGEALFPTVRARTRTVAIAKRSNRYALIPTSPIGAPPVELELKGQDMRTFSTRRLAKGSTIYAESLSGLLLAPELVAVQGMQAEVAMRGQAIREDLDLTHENMRLGALFGKFIDADGSVLEDYYTNWGEQEPNAIDMELDDETTNVRAKCKNVIRTMKANAHGGWVDNVTTVHALCGPSAYDLLTTHPMVERLWLGWSAAAELRGDISDNFNFGGIVWHDYRPADDTSTLSPLGDDEIRFFPVGGRDVFQRVLGPAEFDPWINQPGQDIYALTIPDRDRNAWQRIEAYNYPLYVCLRPQMLIKGYGTAAPGGGT